MASRLLLRALSRTIALKAVCPVIGRTYRPSLTSTIPQLRTFTISLPRFSNGENSELVHQLEEEMQFEQADEKNEVPAFIKEFLDSNLFQIEDQLGHDKVVLTRTFGNEKIRVIFSISDINNTAAEKSSQAEEGDNEEGTEKEIIINEEDEENQEEASFPVRAAVMVEKEGKGSLVLNTIAQDGYLYIDSVRYFKQGQLEIEEIKSTNEDLYMGPVYEELDEELQTTFTKYLEERGVDTALATFLPDYVDYKEQKEYVNWLKDVNEFIAA